MNEFVSIDDLSIAFNGYDGPNTVVENVSIQINKGEKVGIVGESGSGKTLTALSLLGLMPSKDAQYTTGSVNIILDDAKLDLSRLKSKSLNEIRGKKIAMIFQEPISSLDPVYKCGSQVDEVYKTHISKDHIKAKQRTLDLFKQVQLDDPERIYNAYPHEISGGQIQRVMIAMALVCDPELLVADEPTTALDVTIQKEIIDLLNRITSEMNMSLLFISHDLALVSNICDRVYVMYQGNVVEHGDIKEVFNNPKERYTQALLECRPDISKRNSKLVTVADVMKDDSSSDGESLVNRTHDDEVVLDIKDISKTYYKSALLGFRKVASTEALKGISVSLKKREILGIVGESGSGKSTLIKCILGIETADKGEVLFEGKNLVGLSEKEWKPLRRKIQIVFQDPYSSLNPKMKIGDAVNEALQVIKYKGNRKKRVEEIFELVDIPNEFYNRYPFQLSGGQRQRVCIARALAMEPEILLCDESVSALDVSVQAQILNLLLDLRTNHNLSIIFITHDFAVVSYLCDRVIVLEHGRLVEENTPENILNQPSEAYTQNLIDSIPSFQ